MAEDDRIHDINTRLGQLEGALRTFMKQWQTQDNAAALGRRVTHEKMELLTVQITRLSTDMQGMQQDVAELKLDMDENILPVVNSVKLDQARRRGAKSVWAMIVGGAVAIGSILAYAIDKLLQFFTIRPPP